MNLIFIDVVFLMVLGGGVFFGLFRGFVTELINFLTLVGGVILAVLFGPLVTEILLPYLNWGGNTLYASYFLIFIGTAILLRIMQNLILNLVDRLNLEALDRVLGLFMGGLEALVIVFIIITLIEIQPLFDPESLLGDSVFYHWIVPYLPQGQSLFEEGVSKLNV